MPHWLSSSRRRLPISRLVRRCGETARFGRIQQDHSLLVYIIVDSILKFVALFRLYRGSDFRANEPLVSQKPNVPDGDAGRKWIFKIIPHVFQFGGFFVYIRFIDWVVNRTANDREQKSKADKGLAGKTINSECQAISPGAVPRLGYTRGTRQRFSKSMWNVCYLVRDERSVLQLTLCSTLGYSNQMYGIL